MPCHAMPCHAMPCHAMPCHAIPYTTQRYATLRCASLCWAVLCCAGPCYNTRRCSIPYSMMIRKMVTVEVVTAGLGKSQSRASQTQSKISSNRRLGHNPPGYGHLHATRSEGSSASWNCGSGRWLVFFLAAKPSRRKSRIWNLTWSWTDRISLAELLGPRLDPARAEYSLLR